MDFDSTFDLAIFMLKQRKQDEGDEDKYDANLIKTLKTFKKKLTKDISIAFTSCNYDTYISKIDGHYFVSTCNNTNWELCDFNVYLSKYPEELSKLEITDSESLEYFYKHYDFWYPEYHLIGRVIKDDDDYTVKTCPHHKYQYDFLMVKNPYVLKNKETVCPQCYAKQYETKKLLSLEDYDL